MNRNMVIKFITTINTDDEPIYIYLLLSAERWKELETRLLHEEVDFSQEGEILAYGKGHTPDDATKAAIQKIIDTLKN